MNKQKKRGFLKLIFNNSFLRQLLIFWKAISSSWRVYLEKPLTVEEVRLNREAASIPSFGFFFLLICATVIASFGLIEDSTAVIIGAMIIAPLMNPILSMAFAIVTRDWTLYKRSMITVALGASFTISIAFILGLLIPVDVVGKEVMARTQPNLIDLGIAIAAGAAGSFSLTRQSIASSIAGVAIAVALVPPLCVTGLGLGIGNKIVVEHIGSLIISNWDVSVGSFLLFIVNLAGITFTACLVFLSQSYGSFHKVFQPLLIWLLIIALVCGPLTGSMKEFIVASRVQLEIRKLREEHPEISLQTQVNHIDVQLEGTTAYIMVLTNAPEDVITDEYLKAAEKRVFDALTNMGVKSIDFVVRIIPVRVEEYRMIKR
ncbi:MAG: DUF389 domain-containing protein [Crocosphaera sp.]|nr:DUF389 domain-containing protein [Crocosphaera sp.]